MTISQPSLRQSSRLCSAASFGGLIRAVRRWQERRRAKADLARLARAGDYLLQDVGLDPALVRHNPAAVLDQISRRR